MAASATVTIAGSITGLPSGSITLAGQVTSAAAVGEILPTTLTSGANTITVPSGATAVLIQPPTGNTVALILKGVSGDTGVKMHLTFPTVLALDATQATFVVNAASLMTSPTIFSFI